MLSRNQILLIMWYILGTLVVLFFVVPLAHAQQSTTTIQGPSPALRFIPQDAYIVPIPPPQAQQATVNNNDGGITPVILSLITSGGAYIAAKMQADKKHKENAAEILKSKEVDKELARVTYEM